MVLMIKHKRNTFWDFTDTVGFQNTSALAGKGEEGDADNVYSYIDVLVLIMFILMADCDESF